jgi:hypothetical protein
MERPSIDAILKLCDTLHLQLESRLCSGSLFAYHLDRLCRRSAPDLRRQDQCGGIPFPEVNYDGSKLLWLVLNAQEIRIASTATFENQRTYFMQIVPDVRQYLELKFTLPKIEYSVKRYYRDNEAFDLHLADHELPIQPFLSSENEEFGSSCR